jgi:uncharacterized SAM-dependent methyltransferase
MAEAIRNSLPGFDLAELGPGDCFKSVYLIKSLFDINPGFTYFPIDISGNVINSLKKDLPAKIPGLRIKGLNGEYLAMLEELKQDSAKNKAILFLGSNIGNIAIDENIAFFKAIKNKLRPGDLLLTGFDLKKDPKIILDAYNDAAGITRRFNLNLLKRINNYLNADFDISRFAHCPEYNAETGACKSYLVSLVNQQVSIGESGIINFSEGEKIFMEISQKYTVAQTEEIAIGAGFVPIKHFQDSKGWFLDALWQYPL